MKLLFSLLLILALLPAVAFAGDMEEGLAAHERGDYQAALKHWRLAAQGGNMLAQRWVGQIYYEGPQPEYEEAGKWFLMAAKQGDATSQNTLGWMYYTSQGVTQDYAEALKWTLLAANQGYAPAQDGIGEMYRDGKGVAQDNVQAYMWYCLAAASKDPVALNDRAALGVKLSPPQRDEGERLAAEWKPEAAEIKASAPENK